MFENILNFFKKLGKNENKETSGSKTKAKERLHLVLMQDRANVSADFLEMMKQEIIEVIKKYVDIDEGAIDVRMTNKPGEDGTVGAPALYANIPIVTIKNEARKLEGTLEKQNIEEERKDDSKDKESQEGQNCKCHIRQRIQLDDGDDSRKGCRRIHHQLSQVRPVCAWKTGAFGRTDTLYVCHGFYFC